MFLLRKALEEDIPTTSENAGPIPNEGNQPNNEEATVVMTGPLGQAYTQALATVFAKPEEDQTETANTSAPTVSETVATESQANDAIMAAGIMNAVTGAEADSIENPEALIYGVSAQDLNEKTVVDIAKELSQFELDQPEEFVVVVDATDMAQQVNAGVDQTELIQNANEYLTQPVNEANLEKAELLPVLESMVTSMGGIVVYSLRQALEEIAKMPESVSSGVSDIEPVEVPVIADQAPVVVAMPVEVEVTGIPAETVTNPAELTPASGSAVEPIPTPEPIAPAGSEVTEPAAPVEPALESDKGGKKKEEKKEAPSSKLNRAKNLINGVISKIKENALRAELHHAVGIIMSAQKDIGSKK